MSYDFYGFVHRLSMGWTYLRGGQKYYSYIIKSRIFLLLSILSIGIFYKKIIRKKEMKSIDIYACIKNNRKKGVDGMDGTDSVNNTEHLSELSMRNLYFAKCYILWGEYYKSSWKSSDDRRVYHDGKAQTICVRLKGADRDDALSKINNDEYEFIRWLN